MDIGGKERTDFSLHEMKVRDGDDFINVIFMGRWLVDCFSEPSSNLLAGSRYAVALTPTNSYFVFYEECDMPRLCRYGVYDCFEWMEESHEVPQAILDAVSSALYFGSAEDNEALEA